MKNKKGFTLIELLAVIVILAIIMVIAVPQILEVINNSRNKAWDESVGLIEDAIELNIGLSGTLGLYAKQRILSEYTVKYCNGNGILAEAKGIVLCDNWMKTATL